MLRSLQTLTTPEVKEEATSPGAPPASASPQPAGATEEQNLKVISPSETKMQPGGKLAALLL